GPLTIRDGYSRYLIDCHLVARLTTVAVRERFLRAFAEHGMPEAIHTDNGVPFAGSGVTGLSRLAVEWVKAGITLERSRPGHPQHNGRHERMHRTLKAETASPPATDRVEQQRRFDRFRAEYNCERPHQALGQLTPAALYQPSARRWPARLEDPWYDADHQVRRVRREGAINVRVQSNGGGRRSSSAKLSAVTCSVSASSRGATTWSALPTLSWASSGQENRACAAAGRTPAYTLMSLSFSLNCPRSIRSDLSSMFPVAQPIDPTHALPQNLKGRALESADTHSPPTLRGREHTPPLAPKDR